MRSLLLFIKDIYACARMRVLLSICLMLSSGLLSGVGILMLIPLLSYSGIIENGQSGIGLLAPFSKILSGIGRTAQLSAVLGIYTSLITLQALITRWKDIVKTRIIQDYTRHLRVSLYEKTLKADWKCLMDKKNSDLCNAFSLEINRVGAGIVYLISITSQTILALFHMAVSFYLSAMLTIVVLILGGTIFFYLKSSFKESKKLGRSLQKINQGLFSGITEQLSGIKEIKSYGIENNQLKHFKNTADAIRQNMMDFIIVQSKPALFYKIGSALAISLFFFFAVTFFDIGAGPLLVIIFIFSRLWPIFSSFQNNLQNIFVMIPSFNSLKKLEAEFSKKREDLTLSCPENGQAGPLFLRDSISFDNVCFRYKDHTDNTFQLKNISFTIKARTMTAFAGPSGSGKSTVIDLLLGLLRPLSGEIIIDNSPLDQGLMKRWRNSIGYVPQDPFLLNCSIRENLQRFTPQASEQEIRNALELAWALELVDKLDKGLDEVIGDRGVKLSGGERQRIVLARALLRKPSILILDEATSSLDTVSEHRIQQALEALHGSLTIIMIAHRLSSVKNADNIIVMSDGKIAEQGTYAELSEKKGGFFRLMLNIDNNKGECENGH